MVSAQNKDQLCPQNLPDHRFPPSAVTAGHALVPSRKELDVRLAVVVRPGELETKGHEAQPKNWDDVLVGVHVLQRGDELLQRHHLGQVYVNLERRVHERRLHGFCHDGEVGRPVALDERGARVGV
eukprot:scaffold80356_cov60-Phaeocystis_antarctica.AAC.5